MSRKLLNLLAESEHLENEEFRLRNLLDECNHRRKELIEGVRKELIHLRSEGHSIATLGHQDSSVCPFLMIDGVLIEILRERDHVEFPLRRVRVVSLPEPDEPF